MGWRFGLAWELPAYLYLAGIGVALAAIDLDTRRLPDAIVLPSYAVGGALLGLASLAEHDGAAALRALGGGVALWAFYLVLRVVKPSGMGLGDVKLSGVLGGYLAWLQLGGPRRGRLRRVPHRRGERAAAHRGRSSRPQEHHPVRPVHARRRPRRRAVGCPAGVRVQPSSGRLAARSDEPPAGIAQGGPGVSRSFPLKRLSESRSLAG